jgi:RNA polymerase sigma-70 factor (ECF subfamily)
MDFQDLYESYAPDVFRFAVWLCGERDRAEDIASETFVRAWSRKDNIRTETLKAYLFTIARNIHLEQRRRDNRNIVLEDIHADSSPGPDRTVESRDELGRIERILQDVPECDRTAFILRTGHEISYAEIARILEISLTSAKVKVHRIRKRLLSDRIKREAL